MHSPHYYNNWPVFVILTIFYGRTRAKYNKNKVKVTLYGGTYSRYGRVDKGLTIVVVSVSLSIFRYDLYLENDGQFS